MEDRLIQLEMKISFLEKDVGELDGCVRELSGDVTTLKKRLEAFERRFGDALHREEPDDDLLPES